MEAVATDDPGIVFELEQLFRGRNRQVKAVVVVLNGHVIAERYAPGYGVDTPLLSFSVAKSITNALAGVLVRQGRLSLYQNVERPEWAGAEDLRSSITANDLLRMQSGLDARESGDGFDPVTHMLLLHDDMAHFAAGRPARARPGALWEYTSANTIILSRQIGDVVGGGAFGMRSFAERELFEPLGMEDVTMEFDGVETFVGSTFVYAPARAYARLGLLFLNDGVAPDGRRILPRGWVDYSRRRTLNSSYGAGFWLASGDGEDARRLRAAGFPDDGYYAWGALGQRIYIVPSRGIVMARFGYTLAVDQDVDADMRLLGAVIASEGG
ncbi:MAG: serine hydrolase domain-containing protein [Hyphomonadaceae bacterium]